MTIKQVLNMRTSRLNYSPGLITLKPGYAIALYQPEHTGTGMVKGPMSCLEKLKQNTLKLNERLCKSATQ
jgi:hypothetical protein